MESALSKRSPFRILKTAVAGTEPGLEVVVAAVAGHDGFVAGPAVVVAQAEVDGRTMSGMTAAQVFAECNCTVLLC